MEDGGLGGDDVDRRCAGLRVDRNTVDHICVGMDLALLNARIDG